MKGSRLVLLLAAFCLVGSALAPAAGARGLLDPGFGDNGVVELPLLSDRGAWIAPIASADGRVFIREDRQTCGRPSCPEETFLRRYTAAGNSDRDFGEVFLGQARYGVGLDLDRTGRALVSRPRRGGGLFLERLLLPGGSLDRSFGDGGSLTIPCRCESAGVSLMARNRLLVSGSRPLREGRRYRGSVWVFLKLREDGRPDRSFGGDGEVRLRMKGYNAPLTVLPHGAGLLLAGETCCHGELQTPYVMRMSSDGRLDRRFGARARRSLADVPGTRPESIGWEWFRLFQRRGGAVEVYGFPYEGRGVAVKLTRDGRRDRSFAGDGVRPFKMDMSDAAPDGAGGTFVVGYRRYEGVIHLLPNGERDRSFGFVQIPGVGSEYGASIQPQGRGAALVFGDNSYLCRSDCSGVPAMARVLWR